MGEVKQKKKKNVHGDGGGRGEGDDMTPSTTVSARAPVRGEIFRLKNLSPRM